MTGGTDRSRKMGHLLDLGYGVDDRGRPLVPPGTVAESTTHPEMVMTYSHPFGEGSIDLVTLFGSNDFPVALTVSPPCVGHSKPLRPLPLGVVEISGMIAVTYQNSKLLRVMRNRSEAHFMRVVRPFMSKRGFQRMRGRMMAGRRIRK